MKSKIHLGLGIHVDNVSEIADKYLTEKAKKDMSNVQGSLSIHKGTEIVGQCLYYGHRTKMSGLEEAVKKVSEMVNALSDEGHVMGSLGPMIKFDLSPETTGYFNEDNTIKEPETIVLAYVHVPLEIYDREMEKIKPVDYHSHGNGD